MGRRKKARSVQAPPRFFRFGSEESPTGVKNTIDLNLDEYEAIRLADNLGYDHKEASTIMGISRPTFTRLLNRARQKIAAFLTNGGTLEITGGQVLFTANVFCCRNCHRPFLWEKDSDPVCIICGDMDVLPAQPSCNHDCRCCEAKADINQN